MNASPDYQTIATVAGYLLMGIMGFFGSILWKDVREMKEKWITRSELENSVIRSNLERDAKHVETTGNFHRLAEKLDYVEARHNESAIAIEKRIGEVLVEVAKLHQIRQRPDGPERRRGF